MNSVHLLKTAKVERPPWRAWLFLPNWLLAYLWTWAWGTCRMLRAPHYDLHLAFMWGRMESPEPTRCERCGWRGPRRWAVHDYDSIMSIDGEGCDVEPADKCPSCGDGV